MPPVLVNEQPLLPDHSVADLQQNLTPVLGNLAYTVNQLITLLNALAVNLPLFLDAPAPAFGDQLGIVSFDGRNSAGARHTYADIRVTINDPAAGTEDGRLDLNYSQNGAIVNGLLVDAPSNGETSVIVRRNVSGTFSLQRVSMGAADSGGSGFKLLRVPN